jgi:hypothetical protein
MPALEERGYFWWNDEPIPQGHLAPASAVAGLLKIDDNGRIDLELDGVLPSTHGPFAAIKDQGKDWTGISRASSKRPVGGFC